MFEWKSEKEIYAGTVDSDDFETATFDVLFKAQNPTFTAVIEYTDFDNNKKTETINLPTQVYTKEKALELGIIQKSKLPLYIGIIVAFVILWIIFRSIRKKRRMKKSIQEA